MTLTEMPAAEVSRMGVTLARLAGIGAQNVLRFKVCVPAGDGTYGYGGTYEAIGPRGAQWGITTLRDHGQRMAKRYHVHDNSAPLDLRTWELSVPFVAPPTFARDEHENPWAAFRTHGMTLSLRAEPVAYAIRAAGKVAPALVLLKANAGVSTGIATFFSPEAGGDLLSLGPCRFERDRT